MRHLLTLCSLLLLLSGLAGCGGTDINEIQGAPPVAVDNDGGTPGGAPAVGQAQLTFTGNANVVRPNFNTSNGARIEAGNTTNPRGFAARLTLPVQDNVTRSLQLTLPEPSGSLRAGASFPIGRGQATASYVESSQTQPTAGKIFSAVRGTFTVLDVTTVNGRTQVTLRFDSVEMQAQRLSASGNFTITGQASFIL